MRLTVFCLAAAVASANSEPKGSSPGYPNPAWRTFFHKPTSPADCAAKCKAHPDCTQAVYEEGGPWGQECWLGGQTSEKVHRGSRGCKRQGGPCVDHCFHPKLDAAACKHVTCEARCVKKDKNGVCLHRHVHATHKNSVKHGFNPHHGPARPAPECTGTKVEYRL